MMFCNTARIGQTSRSILKRMKEHDRTLRFKRPAASAPAEHALDTGHSFDFWNPEILSKPTGHYNRLVRESVEIYKCPTNINRDDGLKLRTAWYPALQKERKINASNVLVSIISSTISTSYVQRVPYVEILLV